MVNAMLVLERERGKGTQNPIYYLSRVLQGVKYKYPPIEKLALAVVAMAQELRPYFQTHVITIPMGYPLLHVL